jgi:hypothetical protein
MVMRENPNFLRVAARGNDLPLACEMTSGVAGGSVGSNTAAVGCCMRSKDTTGTGKASRSRSGRTSSAASPGTRRSSWAPRRAQMVPVALPKRFVDGVAWDEV